MNVDVKLFMDYAKYLPPGSGEMPVSLSLEEGSTGETVMEKLGIPSGTQESILVNGRHYNGGPLKDGDIVAIFPPVAGG